jgi:hypothetical protein
VLVDARVPHRPPQVRRAAVRACVRACYLHRRTALQAWRAACTPAVYKRAAGCLGVQAACTPTHPAGTDARAQTCTLCARAYSVRTDTCAQKLHAPVRPILIPARQTADAGQQAAALPDSRRRWTAGLVQLPDSKGGPCKKRRASSSCRTAADNGRRPLSSEDDK